MKIGIGYDVHPLTEGRKLILGGVEILFEKGLEGYSDADVLLHAIIDAILGAMGEGDIGQHFPSTDPRYKGISSSKLLKEVNEIRKGKGFEIEHIDSTIVAERPKLAPHVLQMEENIAKVLEIDRSKVNVKAKSTEGLGFIGQGQGMAAYAVCLLKSA